MKTAIVIAAWNEEKYITSTLQKTKKFVSTKDIIVVSDGSKDKTVDLAKKEGVTVLDYKPNKGKGNAMRVGCDYAIEHKYDNIVVMDADGQHEPELISTFIKEIEEGKDIVFGIRVGKPAPLAFKIGNFGLTMGIFILSGLPIKDSQSGFRAFTASAYKQVRWDANDYFVETEMIMRAKGLAYTQIPIKKIYLDAQKGTNISIGLRIGWDAFTFFLRRLFKIKKKA